MNTLSKLTIAGAIALFASAANAQGINFDGPLDTDGDGMLTEEEFAPIAGMGGTFVGFDKDGDGMISQIEYNESVDAIMRTEAAGGEQARQAEIDEMTRMFDQANADRDLLEGFFIRLRGDDATMNNDTESGAAVTDTEEPTTTNQ